MNSVGRTKLFVKWVQVAWDNKPGNFKTTALAAYHEFVVVLKVFKCVFLWLIEDCLTLVGVL